MFDEQTLEKVTMEMLQDLEYECINGYEMERTDFSKVLLEEDIVQSIERINRGIKFEQVQEALRIIRNLDCICVNDVKQTFIKKFVVLLNLLLVLSHQHLQKYIK